ncbi:MAG: hypothetical protein HYV37_03495 [Candidatus Levyibacteriota bacterium]|nr:MAG: hypothetical protein HYV37_03495 [Candidatus Levybacteria bacterium]
MIRETNQFPTLFKKYRLRAEFATFSELGMALAEKGLIYENSIFSHWQKGDRSPNRPTIIKLIEIFVERQSINTLGEANGFLESVGEGYLTEKEREKIQFSASGNVPFQVPSQIDNFTGREVLIKRITKEIDLGNILLIHGAAGVGKSALAIKLGHLLKDRYKDGVLWYKIEKDNIMDIFLSIARIFGEDISSINDKQVRATVVRSILTSKNVLLFLDSAELSNDIHLLVPNSQFCTMIITSQKNSLKTPIRYIDIRLEAFTDKEILFLFKEVLKDKYPRNNQESILKIAKTFGNLPLALHILARQLLHSKVPLAQLSKALHQETNKNLYSAIAMSYKKLDNKMQSILLSISIFKGKDFSIKSIAYINGLAISATTEILQNLTDFSLIEHSTKGKYRIHPAIRDFVRDKLDYPRSSYLVLIATIIFIFFTIWWIYLQLFVDKPNIMYQIFATTYCMMAIYGGIYGIHTSFKWGGLKTLLGKATFMFSMGLFMQVFGQVAYAYYAIFKHIVVPYPSVGDLGFFGTIPFYTYGVFLLAKSSGIKLGIQSFRKKIIALIIPGLVLILYYLSFFQNYQYDFSNPIKMFFDIAQPLGNAVYVSAAIITFIFSRTVLDGIMQSKAFLLLVALIIQSIADYIFLYKSSTYYSGNYMDFIYLISYFVMTLALLHLKSLQVKIKNI